MVKRKHAVQRPFGSSKKGRKQQLAKAREAKIGTQSQVRDESDNDTSMNDSDAAGNEWSLAMDGSSSENSSDNENETELSASRKKLQNFSVYRRDNGQLSEDDDMPDSSDWCVLDIFQLNNIVSNLPCPECGSAETLKFDKTGKYAGFSQEIALVCISLDCHFRACDYSSARLAKSDKGNVRFEVNQLMTLLAHELGQGHAFLSKFASVFGMKNMHQKTYQHISKSVQDSYVRAGQENMDTAAKIVRQAYLDLDPSLDPDDTIDIAVSFDGTWQKRGFSSHYGVGTVIEVTTGYVLDYEVLSSYCHACTLAEKGGYKTAAWTESHSQDCAKNHNGSSKSMETQAALRIWSRSVEKYNLRYTRVISDGDSTSYKAVCDAKVYGETEIEKMECLNHCSKRVGTNLLKLAQQCKLGGKGHGKLTKQKCVLLQNYYRQAVLQNLDDIETMKKRIYASLFHCMSTDRDPRHHYCPPGSDSWCFYRRAEAEGTDPPPHAEKVGHPLSAEVVMKVCPLYKRLTDPNLLKKLQHGKTQNSNEALNNLIWVRCPKTVFVGKKKLESAVAGACCKFNEGAKYLTKLMDSLSVQPFELTRIAADLEDADRVQKADRYFLPRQQRNRRARLADRSRALTRQEQQEGATYGAGMNID